MKARYNASMAAYYEQVAQQYLDDANAHLRRFLEAKSPHEEAVYFESFRLQFKCAKTYIKQAEYHHLRSEMKK